MLDRAGLFAPVGSDSLTLIDVLLVGVPEDTKAALRNPKQFLKLLPPPPSHVNLVCGVTCACLLLLIDDPSSLPVAAPVHRALLLLWALSN